MPKKNSSHNATSDILLTPGPVPIRPIASKILGHAMIHHRSAEFSSLFLKLKTYLKKIFQTQQPVLVLNASGTGAMSAALLNTLSKKDSVLVVSAGRFGERWADIAKTYQLKTQILRIPYGQAVTIQKVKTALKKNPHIKALLIQACETSTGVYHPIKELANLTKKKPNILFIVDAISALGAVNINMDQWGIDVLIAGSQKSFGLPAGMSFISLSKKAWKFNQSSQLPVYYLNLKKEKMAQTKNQTAFSANVSYIRALVDELSYTQKKSIIYKKFQHTQQLSQITQQFCNKLNLKIFSHPPSPSVTAITIPAHINGVQLKDHIQKKYRVILAGGQGKLKGRILRIGHLTTHLGITTAKKNLIKGLKALALSLHTMDPQMFPSKKIKKAFKSFVKS